MRAILLSAGTAICLAACSEADTSNQPAPGSQQPDAPAASVADSLEGRAYTADGELSGYFLPQDEVAIGPIELDHIAVLARWEAEAFINGDEDSFPPIGLSFDDTSSPTGVGELGNTYYEVNYWVPADEFNVTDETLSFAGQHEILGEIRFEGQWNRAHLDEMMAGNPQNAQAALSGDLMIGDVVFSGITFQGWLGD